MLYNFEIISIISKVEHSVRNALFERAKDEEEASSPHKGASIFFHLFERTEDAEEASSSHKGASIFFHLFNRIEHEKKARRESPPPPLPRGRRSNPAAFCKGFETHDFLL